MEGLAQDCSNSIANLAQYCSNSNALAMELL